MLRRAAVVLLAVGAVLASGCASKPSDVPPVSAASPQRAELGWDESTPKAGPALVFRVHRLAVTETGWEANVEIENRTEITWELGADELAVTQSFGVMLFETAALHEVESRGRDRNLPGLRPAQRFVPSIPLRLVPGRRWRATVSAAGTLAAGRYLRIVFGPLVASGEPPEGLPREFVWITDHAYRLRR